MRTQLPSDNNPHNPLFKVVALNVSKEIENGNSLSLECELGFKKSANLTGGQKNVDQKVVSSVNFHLSVRRAVLEIESTGDKPPGFKVDSIAHTNRGYVFNKDQTELVHQSERAMKLAARLGIIASADILNLSPSAEAQARFDHSNSKSRKQSRSSQDIRNTISGTFDSNIVHWEIEPNAWSFEKSHPVFIEGEVFDLQENGTRLRACTAKWTSGSAALVDVRASVLVQVKDLNISDIEIFDVEGELVKRPPSVGFHLNAIEMKNKFVKQILKKHLLSQGLSAEGSYFEVSRAYG